MVKKLKGQNVELDKKTKGHKNGGKNAEWDLMLNGKKRRREIKPNVVNAEWEKMSTGNNIECNQCRISNNVEW
jgi:hypothetical protein